MNDQTKQRMENQHKHHIQKKKKKSMHSHQFHQNGWQKKNYFADNSRDCYGDYSDCRLKIASFNRISIETII